MFFKCEIMFFLKIKISNHNFIFKNKNLFLIMNIVFILLKDKVYMINFYFLYILHINALSKAL